MEWLPKLAGDGPLHERIAAALRRDLQAGVLQPGERLPPQRRLADRLGISVGTVTKAFQEAERLGLVAGEVGRGTYVKAAAESGADMSASRPIDFSVNTVPLEAAGARLAETLKALQRRPATDGFLAYAPPAGFEAHRKAGAVWLARTARFAGVDWSRLVVTGGGQQAMWLAFAALCVPGDVILCEAATYYGMKALAEQAGYQLRGVAMDEEGIVPDAFEKAAHKTGARVAYLMPSVQVPTARTMSMRRRLDILKIARKRQISIVEDDNYPLFAPALKAGIAPLAELAPENCVYVASVSKMLSPGLRTGFLVAPTQDMFDRISRILRSTVYAIGSFGAHCMSEWVMDGSGFEIAADMVNEIAARWKLAINVLAGGNESAFPLSPHLWLQMDELETERAAGRAQRAGAIVTPPELPVLNAKLISGLRICIGAPKTRGDLQLGLERLRAALAGTPEASGSAI